MPFAGGLVAGAAALVMVAGGFAGDLCGVGFLVYNGYWLLGGAISVFTPGRRRRAEIGPSVLYRRSGSGRPHCLTAGVAAWLGHNLFAEFRTNSATISQGDFGLGYRVIAEYLWSGRGCFAFFS